MQKLKIRCRLEWMLLYKMNSFYYYFYEDVESEVGSLRRSFICVEKLQVYNFSLLKLNLLNRDLNRGCLVYMISLRFSGSTFLINIRRQFRVRKNFRTQDFAGFIVFSFCV